jgi:hypothetical protein
MMGTGLIFTMKISSKSFLQNKVIRPVFIGTVAITVCVFLLRSMTLFAPVVKLSVLIAHQADTSVEAAFLLLCGMAVLFTYFYITQFDRKVMVNNLFFKGISFGFVTAIFSLMVLLTISVLAGSIISYAALKPLLLSVLVIHIAGGFVIAVLAKLMDAASEENARDETHYQGPLLSIGET